MYVCMYREIERYVCIYIYIYIYIYMLAPPPETPPRPWFKQNLPAFASASQSPPQHLARISQPLWRASQGFPQAIGRACRQNAPRDWARLPPRTSQGNRPSMPQGFGPFLARTLNAIYKDADSPRRAPKNAPRIWPSCPKFLTTLPHALRKAIAQECPQDSARTPQRTLQDFPARLP